MGRWVGMARAFGVGRMAARLGCGRDILGGWVEWYVLEYEFGFGLKRDESHEMDGESLMGWRGYKLKGELLDHSWL
jgi:hypothetical protein